MQIQKKNKAGLAVAALFALAAFVPTHAAAAPVSVLAGDIVKLYDGPGTTGGGEFWADVVGKGVSGTINGSNNDFITFCLEHNETFSSYGQPLKVAAVNTGAVNGGVSGQTSLNFDPLSAKTAWLYTQAMTNPGILGYTHTTAKANSLQNAIWFLEGELGASFTLAQLNTLDSQAKTWVDAALASSWTTIGNVRVLNLLKKDGAGNYTLNSQDQIYIMPVPEPETYAMLLAGLGLMGFVARRRRNRAL
ncbi:MAG: PEP-CTERM sorting domain-containing protein [Chthoniobacteraceae bacterium]